MSPQPLRELTFSSPCPTGLPPIKAEEEGGLQNLPSTLRDLFSLSLLRIPSIDGLTGT